MDIFAFGLGVGALLVGSIWYLTWLLPMSSGDLETNGIEELWVERLKARRNEMGPRPEEESKMTFGEAMTEAALGKTVRRKAWPSQWRVHMLKNALFNHEGMPFIPGSGIYTNDWELYEPKLSVDQKADRYDIIEKVVNGKVELDSPWAAVKRIVKEGV